MIDQDGIERPDDLNAHGRKLTEGTRKIKFDEKYNYCPRNIFFRIWMLVFKCVAGVIFCPIFYIMYRVKVYGRENYRKLRKKPFVVTSNHVHVFDIFGVGAAVMPFRRMYTSVLQTSIKRPLLGFWMRSVGCIPIPNTSVEGMQKYEADLAYILEKRKNPIMYAPEGSLWPNYRGIRPFKKGAFALAVKNNVPILPVAVVFKRKQKRNKKYKYYLNYIVGEPIYQDEKIEEKTVRIDDMRNRTFKWYEDTLDKWYENKSCGF